MASIYERKTKSGTYRTEENRGCMRSYVKHGKIYGRLEVTTLGVIDDAIKYLNKWEWDMFEEAVLDATDVYPEKGGKYLADYRYRLWLETIDQRKKEERRKTTAQSQAWEYNQRLNNEIARLRQSLYHDKKRHSAYFEEQVNDPRYLGYSFKHILSDENKQVLSKSILSIGKRELDKLVAEDFRQFVDWEVWRWSYFPLPSADYSFQGVPCLDFMFQVFGVVEIRLSLKPGRRSFLGYAVDLPQREEKGHGVPLQEPEFLGYRYVIANPSDLGCVPWQSIPLILVVGLLNGQTKPGGVTISAASDDRITYKVPKFKEDIIISDSFARYMAKIGTIDDMLSMGTTSKKVAGIIKNELQLPSPLEGEIERRDTKKARAFRLFSDGKRPGDPKVKGLGIKPSTAYRYYQDWKKGHSS